MSQSNVQALATDEAETICKLEKRNFDLVELQKKLEEKMEMEREKLKRALDNAKKEGELLKILVNELHREIEGKDEQIKEIGTQLAEAKDDVLKLEEANSRLKGQVLVCANSFYTTTVDTLLYALGAINPSFFLLLEIPQKH